VLPLKDSLLTRFKNLVPSNKVALFLLKLLALYLIWAVLYVYMDGTESQSFFVKLWYGGYHILLKSAMFLSIQLSSAITDIPITSTYREIILENHGTLFIGNACLCADVMFLFAAFIVAYPGQRKAKLWFIPMGILAIHMINILRISALCSTKIYYPEMMNINHKYIFNIIVFAFVFILWLIWITRFSEVDLLNKNTVKKDH